jgi:hypothetical protein
VELTNMSTASLSQAPQCIERMLETGHVFGVALHAVLLRSCDISTSNVRGATEAMTDFSNYFVCVHVF